METNYALALMLCLSTSRNIFLFFYPILMFFVSSLFGIKEHKYINKEKVNSIIQHIKHDYAFKYNDNNEPFGLIIHKNTKWFLPCYLCWVSESDYDKRIIIYSGVYRQKLLISGYNSNESYSLNNTEPIAESTEHSIEYYSEYGTYQYIRYTSRNITITQEYTAKQKEISENIIQIYNKNKHVVSYIYGDIGKGKTMLCYILAKQLKGSLCDTFTPSKPGSYFEDLYTQVAPTKNKPFILLLDEIDIMLEQIHSQKIIQHKNISTQIYDKTTWNRFFDNIQRGMYPYLIVVLCSNISDNRINQKYDPSYLRKGRIDLTFNL